jgi:hypothetical protein
MIFYNLLNKYRKYGHRKNRLDREKTGWIPISDYYNFNWPYIYVSKEAFDIMYPSTSLDKGWNDLFKTIIAHP